MAGLPAGLVAAKIACRAGLACPVSGLPGIRSARYPSSAWTDRLPRWRTGRARAGSHLPCGQALCGNSSMFVGIDKLLSELDHCVQPGGSRRWAVRSPVSPLSPLVRWAGLEVGSGKQ